MKSDFCVASAYGVFANVPVPFFLEKPCENFYNSGFTRTHWRAGAGPLIAFARINQLGLLTQVFEGVLMTDEVINECTMRTDFPTLFTSL